MGRQRLAVHQHRAVLRQPGPQPVDVLLLSRLRLRYRSALLAGLSLMNYSEFGLIVVSVGVSAGLLEPVWLVEMSIAVALSFVVSALVNGRGHLVVEKIAARLPAQDEAA